MASAYVLWAAWFVAHHPVVSLAHVGTQFQQRDGGSRTIGALDRSATDTVGYDGQFYLYVALDPGRARRYLDVPAYRLSRPVYPLVARLAAFGRSGLIPWALLALGIVGVAAGTLALAIALGRDAVSPWYAALFGLYPGALVAVSYDLAEPLAYGLASLGLLAFGRDGRRPLLAGLLFGVAGATRETTLLFPLALAAWLAIGAKRTRHGALLLAVSLAPYLAVKGGLALWLHSAGTARATQIAPAPFLGLVEQWPWGDAHVQQVLSVVLPALLAVALAWSAIRAFTAELSALVANVLVLVVLLPEPSYVEYRASGRIASGVILAFLLCLPAVLRAQRLAQAWILAVLWFAPWYAVLPSALRR